MRPYSNLQTKNLTLVLLIARLFAYLGFIILLTALATTVSKYVDSINQFTFIPPMAILTFAMFALFGSALLAFLVAIEETYRKSTTPHNLK